MTTRDLTYHLFFVSPWRNCDCYAAQILQILLWQWKEDLRTSKKTDNLANLCFSLGIRCHRFPPSFCSAHSPACSLSRPRLQQYDTVSVLFFLLPPLMTGESFWIQSSLFVCFSVTSASKTVYKYMLLSLAAISCMKYCQVTRWVKFSAAFSSGLDCCSRAGKILSLLLLYFNWTFEVHTGRRYACRSGS